ncbi:MAG: hypothetical protein QOE71_1884, partial [Pseudonocardiales bacterium]|nr:hypothetical protein [Pseudonocardiales bacterium]
MPLPSAPHRTARHRSHTAAVATSNRFSPALQALVAISLLLASSLVLLASPAHADTVTNNVTVGGNDTTTVGNTTTVTYRLNATHDPGEPGSSAKCNAKEGTVFATVSIAVPNGTTSTVSPSSISFTDCSTAVPVSLSVNKAGDYT